MIPGDTMSMEAFLALFAIRKPQRYRSVKSKPPRATCPCGNPVYTLGQREETRFKCPECRAKHRQAVKRARDVKRLEEFKRRNERQR